jgi:dynein intermediate chain
MPYLSYSSSSLSSTMTAISSLHNPIFIPSSSLNNNNNTITTTTSTNHNNDQLLSPSPNNSTLQHSYSNYADGLTLLWNLTMPNRPEHVFTCGSPVLNAKFHPSEAHLVIGACYSGQVVVWDVRSGRLPVQRSSLNVLGNSSGLIGSGSGKRSMMGGGGHVHPIVGMEVIESGSGLVTAASDGQLNFWSFSNLYDPAESIVVQGANISSLAIAPETQSILVGDECGNIHAISSSNASNSANNGGTTIEDTSNSTKITSRTSGGSSSTRRFIRKLQPNLKSTPGNEMSSIPSSQESQLACHYGMVTGLSTRNHVKGNQSAIGLSRGFARGAKGLVLSCGVDWTVKLWSPAISDKPLLTFLSHSYDYMSDVQW